jgi:hypothetical protein
MYKPGLKLTEMSKKLSMLPDDKLDEVKDFIGRILAQNEIKQGRIVQMEGIWEGKGFEKLNLEQEIKAVKSDLSKSILKREI